MISIANLHYSYGRKEVFRGLNLTLEPGHIYGLLGRNGTGKSTLLHNLGGLLFPQKGSINMLGFKPSQRLPSFLEQVFLVPENFYLPPLLLKKWVRVNAPFYPSFSRQEFDRILSEFDVPADVRLDELSYGQQKKAFIAFALATDPAVLLMDEPTNGLDIVSKSQFRKVIAGSVDERKCILISTHQVRDLENLIDEVVILDEGKILFNQSMEDIARKLEFRFSFDREEPTATLYSESALQGNALVLANTDGRESRIDLEMLYKTLITNGEALNKIFIR